MFEEAPVRRSGQKEYLIVVIPRRAKPHERVAECCQDHNIRLVTFYKWLAKFGRKKVLADRTQGKG